MALDALTVIGLAAAAAIGLGLALICLSRRSCSAP
jgi:hypothetical protein